MNTTSPNGQASQEARINNTAKSSSGSGLTNRSNQPQRNALDLFANLLGLAHGGSQSDALTDTSQAAADLSSGEQADDTTATQGAQDPSELLAALLAWDPVSGRSGGNAITPSSLASAPGKGPPVAAESELLGKKATLAGGADQGISLQGMGMTPLKQATSPDAATLAAMDLRGANAASGKQGLADPVAAQALSSSQSVAGAEDVSASNPLNSALTAQAKMASRPANWRSTATLGPGGASGGAPASAVRSNSPLDPTNAVQIAQNTIASMAKDTSGAASALRSTVALDERYSTASATDLTTLSDDIASGHGQAHDPSQRNFKGDEQAGASPWSGTTTENSDSVSEESPFMLEADLSPEDPNDSNEQWIPNQLRQANVSVGAGTDERIDIRIALEGEAVNVRFLSDNAEVRAGLQDEAGTMLSELMDRSGLHLSGVSIQSQSQSSAGQQGRPQAERMPQALSSRKVGTTDSAEPVATGRTKPAQRADGGPSLDIFA